MLSSNPLFTRPSVKYKYKAQTEYNDADYITKPSIIGTELVGTVMNGKSVVLTLSSMTASSWFVNGRATITGSTNMNGTYYISAIDGANNKLTVTMGSYVDIVIVDGIIEPATVADYSVEEGVPYLNIEGEVIGYTYNASKQFLIEPNVEYVTINNIGGGGLTYSLDFGINNYAWQSTSPTTEGSLSGSNSVTLKLEFKGKWLLTVLNITATNYYIEGA